jgi:hypothetical protein
MIRQPLTKIIEHLWQWIERAKRWWAQYRSILHYADTKDRTPTSETEWEMIGDLNRRSPDA